MVAVLERINVGVVSTSLSASKTMALRICEVLRSPEAYVREFDDDDDESQMD